MPDQLSLDDYARMQSESISAVRMQIALEVTGQAENLLRHSEHHTFASAVDLLMRLRAEEPHNASAKQQVSERLHALLNNGKRAA